MRWEAVFSILSDARVLMLVILVLVAIVIAVILTFVEIRMRKLSVKKLESVEKPYVDKVKRIMRKKKEPREKLDLIGKTAKKYFHETFGTSESKGYSALMKDLEKEKKYYFVDFCNSMFLTYYSSKEITVERVKVLSKEFIDAMLTYEKEKISSNPLSSFDKIDLFLWKIKKFFKGFGDRYYSWRHQKKVKKQVVLQERIERKVKKLEELEKKNREIAKEKMKRLKEIESSKKVREDIKDSREEEKRKAEEVAREQKRRKELLAMEEMRRREEALVQQEIQKQNLKRQERAREEERMGLLGVERNIDKSIEEETSKIKNSIDIGEIEGEREKWLSEIERKGNELSESKFVGDEKWLEDYRNRKIVK